MTVMKVQKMKGAVGSIPSSFIGILPFSSTNLATQEKF
jgi:hypothetical protein